MFSRYVVGPDGCSSRLWASGASRCRLVCHLSKWQAVRLLCLAVLSLAASSMLCFCEVAMGQVMGIVIGAFSQACSSYCGCQAMSRAFHLDSRVLSCDHWPIYCPVRSGTMWSTCNAGLRQSWKHNSCLSAARGQRAHLSLFLPKENTAIGRLSPTRWRICGWRLSVQRLQVSNRTGP